MNRLTKLSTLAALLSFLGSFWVWYHDLRAPRVTGNRRRVLELPIQIQEGYSISNVFTVDTAATYSLSIECKSAIPLDLLDQALSKDLAVEFTITSNAVMLAHGDSFQSGHAIRVSNYFTRRISEFYGEPGAEYGVSLRVSRSMLTLAPTDPRLTVSVNPSALKNKLVAVSASGIKTLGLFLAGMLLLLPLLAHIISRPRKR